MALREPFPELDALLAGMGEAGSRTSEIDAGEAGAAETADVAAAFAVESPWVRS